MVRSALRALEAERKAHAPPVWQCRYSGIEVPDAQGRHASFGVGKAYADDQADTLPHENEGLAIFDARSQSFADARAEKGRVADVLEA